MDWKKIIESLVAKRARATLEHLASYDGDDEEMIAVAVRAERALRKLEGDDDADARRRRTGGSDRRSSPLTATSDGRPRHLAKEQMDRRMGVVPPPAHVTSREGKSVVFNIVDPETAAKRHREIVRKIGG